MPFGTKPQCQCCETTTAVVWRRNDKDEVVCNECSTTTTTTSNNNGGAESTTTTTVAVGGGGDVVVRKSTRGNKTGKPRPNLPSKSSVPKGKGRRAVFKKSATKAPTAVATVVTTGSVFYKGNYFQIGDIVSVIDVHGGVYYAQIRGLLQDQYCEKSAVLTWLLPTEASPVPEDGFDASTYVVGPEEDVPRRLDCMQFVCHAPSDYFKARDAPYPTEPQKPELAFVWSRIRPHIKAYHAEGTAIF